MRFAFNDGGRAAAGYRGRAGDCTVRAIAIATGLPYQKIYDDLFDLNRQRRGGPRRKSPRDAGTSTDTIRKYMAAMGWAWIPTMQIGSGCKVHLHDGELPMGRLVVRLSGHLTAVIDGVIHDTFDPQHDYVSFEPDTGRELKPGEDRNVNGIFRTVRRCVYGYWTA
jgi:hypothetical protein